MVVLSLENIFKGKNPIKGQNEVYLFSFTYETLELLQVFIDYYKISTGYCLQMNVIRMSVFVKRASKCHCRFVSF